MFKHEIIRFFRSYFKPIDSQVAKKWVDRTQLLYPFLAFQALLVSYYFYQKEKIAGAAYEIEETDVERAIRVLGLKNAQVKSYGSKTEDFYLDGKEVLKRHEEKKKQMAEKFSL